MKTSMMGNLYSQAMTLILILEKNAVSLQETEYDGKWIFAMDKSFRTSEIYSKKNLRELKNYQ